MCTCRVSSASWPRPRTVTCAADGDAGHGERLTACSTQQTLFRIRLVLCKCYSIKLTGGAVTACYLRTPPYVREMEPQALPYGFRPIHQSRVMPHTLPERERQKAQARRQNLGNMRSYKVLLIGESGVGKSTLVARLCEDRFLAESRQYTLGEGWCVVCVWWRGLVCGVWCV